MLREVEVEVGRGKTVAESVKKIGVTDDAERKNRRPWVTLAAAVVFRRCLRFLLLREITDRDRLH